MSGRCAIEAGCSRRMAAMKHVELYTDGACKGNPGPGGWAYILRHPDTGAEVEGSDGDARTTNNRMELMAVIEGLSALSERCQVDVYSDSQYVIKGLEEWMDGWKKKGWMRNRKDPVKNVELWKQLDELRTKHELRYHWVKGHSDHPMNDRCDELAVAAAKRYQTNGGMAV